MKKRSNKEWREKIEFKDGNLSDSLSLTNKAIEMLKEYGDELDRAIRILNDRLLRIETAEALLKEITVTGSHYQIKEKIDKYFKKYPEDA